MGDAPDRADAAEPPDDAADAFELVGHEIRLGIVRALADARDAGRRQLRYAELQSRVGVRDSGQFNYHLQRLLGPVVRETGDGYGMTYVGRAVASAVASGTYTVDATVDPEPVDGTCYACGEAALTMAYRDEQFRVACGACGEEVVHVPFPPGGVVDRSPAALRRAFDRWSRRWHALAADGVCPECGGQMAGHLARDEGRLTMGDVDVRAVLDCRRCWSRGYLPVGCLLVDRPTVVSFRQDAGRTDHTDPIWRHHWALSADFQSVVGDDPLRVEVRIPGDGRELSVTVDDELGVVETVEEPAD